MEVFSVIKEFYRNNKKPIWNEFIYENIELVDNGVAAIGKKL